jgi:predicted membrane protein
MLAWMGALFAIAAAALTVPILRHAFGRSLGTGLMVLLIPAYVAWFAVGQFEHRRKALLVPAWFACIGVAAVCLGVHATRVSFAELLAPVR